MKLTKIIPTYGSILGLVLLSACGNSENENSTKATVTNESDTNTTEANSSVLQGPLAYLNGYAGSMSFDTNFFASEPFNGRLKSLLKEKHKQVLRDLNVQGPIKVEAGSVWVSGCRPHNCNLIGTMIHVDLSTDNILVGYLKDKFVSVYSEKPLAKEDYPEAFRTWAAKNPIKIGKTTDGVKDAVATGKFTWVIWEKAPEELRNELKKLRWGKGKTEYENALFALREKCKVSIAQYDLNRNGVLGILIRTEGCMFHCGSAGCNVKAYDGNKKLSVNDQDLDQLVPGKNGVVTSQGVLIPLR